MSWSCAAPRDESVRRTDASRRRRGYRHSTSLLRPLSTTASGSPFFLPHYPPVSFVRRRLLSRRHTVQDSGDGKSSVRWATVSIWTPLVKVVVIVATATALLPLAERARTVQRKARSPTFFLFFLLLLKTPAVCCGPLSSISSSSAQVHLSCLFYFFHHYLCTLRWRFLLCCFLNQKSK